MVAAPTAEVREGRRPLPQAALHALLERVFTKGMSNILMYISQVPHNQTASGTNRIRHDVAPVWGLQLPAVEVFGLFVTAQQLLIAAALTIFFGWRMLVFLAIVCECPQLVIVRWLNWCLCTSWISTPLIIVVTAATVAIPEMSLRAVVIVKVNSTPPAAPRNAAGSGPGAAADFIRDYMATNPTRPSSTAKDPWGGRGKGQKLGSK